MKFWTKGFVFSFIFLILSASFIVLLIFNQIFLSIPWMDLIYNYLRPWLLLLFYNYTIFVYAGIFICYALLLVLYVLGYNLVY